MADAKNYCGSSTLLLITIFLVLHVTPAAAFGAGNIGKPVPHLGEDLELTRGN